MRPADNQYMTLGQFAFWGGIAFLAYRILWKNNLDEFLPKLGVMIRQKEWRALRFLAVALVFGVGFWVFVWLVYLRPATGSR